MSRQVIRAAWVVPVSGPPIRDGYVEICDDRISAVGAWADRDAAGSPPLPPVPSREGSGEGRTPPHRDRPDSPVPADRALGTSSTDTPLDAATAQPRHDAPAVIDLGSAILTPGLINAHTHLELTCYAEQIEPSPFWEWIPRLVRLRAAPGQLEREARGVEDGAWRSVRAGVTCVGDVSRRNVHWRALQSIPMRKVCFVELLSLADDPPRNMDELRAGVAEVEEDALLTVGVTPHAPYSVPGHEIAESVLLARTLGRPWTTHWMETREECAFIRGEVASPHPFLASLLEQCGVVSPRKPPLDYLAACLVRANAATANSEPGCRPRTAGLRSDTSTPLPAREAGEGRSRQRGRHVDSPASADPGSRMTPGGPTPPLLLAHMNYPEPGDARRVAALGASIAYCPRAHRFFGHPPHPYRAYRDAGVNVVLATDSLASNWSLSLLEEARFIRRETPDPPPAAELLDLLTRGPAWALGLDALVGTLEPGKQADLAAFSCPPDTDDPAAFLVDHAPPAQAVWVAGRLIPASERGSAVG